MEQTKKLYDLDAYNIEFDAKVLSCTKVEEKDGSVYEVILDQTLFFPEEGGQSPDQGNINDIKVLDVQIKNQVITHKLEQPLEQGSSIHGVIDWEHRFNNMQQHSGEHIFSGLVHKKYGYDNVGFHLSNQIVTMDFNGVLTAEQAEEIERKANEVIISNRTIEVTYPSKEELADLDYRSKIEIDGQVRIVTIPGVDVCACCAPHVKRTSEIGMLKIMTMQNYKGGVRISILCGFRALEDYRKRIAAMTELSNLLSASIEALPEAVNRLKSGNQTLKYDLNAARQDYLKIQLEAIPNEQENVFLFEKTLDAAIIRNAVNQLTAKHPGVCGIFAENGEDGYQFILGSANVDTRVIMKRLKEQLNARGGGSAAMVQGSVLAQEEVIKKLIEELA